MRISWRRAIRLGLLSWLIPFVLSIVLFPFKRPDPPLYMGLMNLIGLLTAAALLPAYFRGRTVSMREAILVAGVWLALNLALDYPFFFHGPMRMTPSNYYSEIGVGYLALPAFAFGAARLART